MILIIHYLYMTENFRPHPENPKQHAPEAGAGPLGLPPPDPELTAQGGGSKRSERQPLPIVWEILEQKVKLDLLAIDVDDDLNNESNKEYYRQRRAVERLERQLDKNGTARDFLIFKLFGSITTEPAPEPFGLRPVSIRDLRKIRVQVDTMTEEEIANAIDEQEAKNHRLSERYLR